MSTTPSRRRSGQRWRRPGASVPVESGPLPEADAEQAIAMGEETAELDMQAFLDADARMADAEPQAPEQIPGQERLTFE